MCLNSITWRLELTLSRKTFSKSFQTKFPARDKISLVKIYLNTHEEALNFLKVAQVDFAAQVQGFKQILLILSTKFLTFP